MNILDTTDVCGYSNLEYNASESYFVSKISYNEIVKKNPGIQSISVALEKPVTNEDLTLDIFYSNSTQFLADTVDANGRRNIRSLLYTI
ncbi:MAG: hypothetical protein QM751_13595 [Paludibacteraceae bacterium]